jgi:hypothetical protein
VAFGERAAVELPTPGTVVTMAAGSCEEVAGASTA